MIWFSIGLVGRSGSARLRVVLPMLADGRVRGEDREGNDAADIAADFGRLRQPEVVINARRMLLRVTKEWYPQNPVPASFQGCNDGSIAVPLVWDRGSKHKVRRVDDRVVVDLAQLPGPPGFLDHYWVSFDSGLVTGVDVAHWPFAVPLLIKFTSFLSTLQWPERLKDMGEFGVSDLERPGRALFAGSSPVSEGGQIRLGCQFVGSLCRSLAFLPGGLGGFIPGDVGPHLCRLRHVHGLTFRPLESSMPDCLVAVLDFLGYPAGSVARLSNGVSRL